MTPFDEIKRIADESGIEPALEYLEQSVRRGKDYPSLFEVLKMRVRHKLRLPLLYSDRPDELTEEQQRELEDGLINACREVGTLLFREGDFQRGWMYLQPVGDRELNRKLLEAIEPNEENIDSLIDTAITQGAAPAYGYRLLLEHYGTCNGITTFETQSAAFDRETQCAMAAELLDHLYDELMNNLKYSFEQNGQTLTGDSLEEALNQFPELTAGGAHHIDTTHLASLMRIARMIDDPGRLKKAYQLARYGNGLSSDYHYEGHPPFEKTYPDHLLYFGALTGAKEVDVDHAVTHFLNKIEAVNPDQFGPIAIESAVEFLVRLGRREQALKLTMDQLLGQHPPMGIAPDPMTIANTEPLRAMLVEFYKQQNDLVSFAAGLLG